MFDNFTFQWHITNKCNSRCSHCYQNDFEYNGLSPENLKIIFFNLKAFTYKLSSLHKKKITKHINITGGEPLLRNDIFDFIKLLQPYFSIGLLSNGTLINDETAQTIKLNKIRFVQVSLDGNRQIHDELRYTGSFDETIRAIRSLKKINNFVTVAFTINKKNYTSIREVISICKKNKVDKLWFDRYLPLSAKDDALQLDTDDLKYFLSDVIKERKNNSKGMQISMERALQFLVGGNNPYQCKAGKNLLAILPDGTLLPCRRLPIVLGNILHEDLFEIYNKHERLLELRDSKNEIKGCKKCIYQQTCNGGLKCLSYAVTGNFSRKDINCWI